MNHYENIWAKEGGSNWDKLHDDELHNGQPLVDIITVIGSTNVRWARCTAHLKETRNS
jgi:hypothetical protein